MLGILRRAEGRQRPAVERPLQGNRPVAFAGAIDGVVLAGDFYRAFHRLGARIAEKGRIGETSGGQPLGIAALLGNLVQVRDMPQTLRLFGQRRHQLGMAVPHRDDRNAAGAVEIALAIGRNQVRAFAPLECDRYTPVGLHDGVHE